MSKGDGTDVTLTLSFYQEVSISELVEEGGFEAFAQSARERLEEELSRLQQIPWSKLSANGKVGDKGPVRMPPKS